MFFKDLVCQYKLLVKCLFFFFPPPDTMANVLFSEQENACLRPPALKMRQRLQSAPGMENMFNCLSDFFFFCGTLSYYSYFSFLFLPEKLLKSPVMVKKNPVSSARKAFGAVNKKILTPASSTQEKKVLKPQVKSTNACLSAGSFSGKSVCPSFPFSFIGSQGQASFWSQGRGIPRNREVYSLQPNR